MKAIADATGGEFYASPSQLPTAARVPSTRTRVLGNQVFAPFDSAWMFVALVGLFGCEFIGAHNVHDCTLASVLSYRVGLHAPDNTFPEIRWLKRIAEQ